MDSVPNSQAPKKNKEVSDIKEVEIIFEKNLPVNENMDTSKTAVDEASYDADLFQSSDQISVASKVGKADLDTSKNMNKDTSKTTDEEASYDADLFQSSDQISVTSKVDKVDLDEEASCDTDLFQHSGDGISIASKEDNNKIDASKNDNKETCVAEEDAEITDSPEGDSKAKGTPEDSTAGDSVPVLIRKINLDDSVHANAPKVHKQKKNILEALEDLIADTEQAMSAKPKSTKLSKPLGANPKKARLLPTPTFTVTAAPAKAPKRKHAFEILMESRKHLRETSLDPEKEWSPMDIHLSASTQGNPNATRLLTNFSENVKHLATARDCAINLGQFRDALTLTTEQQWQDHGPHARDS